MHRPAAQETALDKGTHPPGCVAELIIMPHRYLALPFVRELD
jgi:hypothetical protein